MSLQISIPGKTFIAGEYLALTGSAVLLFASKPLFTVQVEKATTSNSWPDWHPQSPAGALLEKHRDYFSQFSIQFADGYRGLGGFGASTAQFLAVYCLWLFKDQATLEMQPLLDFKHLLSEYEQVSWSGEGARPSGADLVTQLKGSFTFFDKSQGLISVKAWPFADLDFILAHTGNKVATHEHLKSLKSFSPETLQHAFETIRQSFESIDSSLFVEGVREYASALQNLGFTCQPTLNLLKEVLTLPGVRTAKGCGALGSDVILVVCEPEWTDKLKSSLSTLNLTCLATSKDVSAGLQIKGSL